MAKSEMIKHEEDEKIYDMFQESLIYRTFIEMYPNAIESFSTTSVHLLELEQYDAKNNILVLMMIFDKENYHYYFSVGCISDIYSKSGGAPFSQAYNYLLDNDCLTNDVTKAIKFLEDNP